MLSSVQGYTPLSIAALRGYFDVVKYLIENGADMDQVDNEVGWNSVDLPFPIFTCFIWYSSVYVKPLLS